jgi:hypothetical protein
VLTKSTLTSANILIVDEHTLGNRIHIPANIFNDLYNEPDLYGNASNRLAY